MAQIVKLEPGDILVLANVGEAGAEALRECWDSVRKAVGIEYVWVFEGDVDLSKVQESEVASFVRVYLNDQIKAQEAAWRRNADTGVGGE